MEFNTYKMKIKAYFLKCHLHKSYDQRFKSAVYRKNGIQILSTKEIASVIKELSTDNFYGYSSIFINIDFACDCNINKTLQPIYNAMQKNEHLKYITKIILAHSSIKLQFTPTNVKIIQDDKECTYLKLPTENELYEYVNQISSTSSPSCSTTVGCDNRLQSVQRQYLQHSNEIREKLLNEYNANLKIILPAVDNLIVIQFKSLVASPSEPSSRVGSFLMMLIEVYLFETLKNQSVQEICQNMSRHKKFLDCARCHQICSYAYTSTEGCYVLNINPALAIILNHTTFNNSLDIREASKHDIHRLKDVFMRKKIAHIILKDGSAQEVQDLMTKVEQTKFRNLKYLYIIIMSHGDEGDIIHTKTDDYNINETVIKPLMANTSLLDVQKFILLNACRGSIDPRYEVDDIIVEATDVNILDESFARLFSTQKGCISLLSDNGAIFIQKFCEIFEKPFNEMLMREIAEEIERRLLNEYVFFDNCVTEFCARPNIKHKVKMEFQNVNDFENLWNELFNYVKSKTIKLHDNEIETLQKIH